MFKRIKQSIVVLAFALLAAVPLAMPASVSAQIQEGLCGGSNLQTEGQDCDTATSDSTSDIQELIEDIINLFSIVVGVVSVIMIIVGGFKYITSGGESNNVTGAKNTIMYAVIGLVVVALAQFIVQFVLNKVTT